MKEEYTKEEIELFKLFDLPKEQWAFCKTMSNIWEAHDKYLKKEVQEVMEMYKKK